MSKLIHISLIPNLLKKDIFISLKYLFCPWYWNKFKKGIWEEKVVEKFSKKFGFSRVFFFDKGRSALSAAIETLGLKKGDEVILQAYTCAVVPNAVWSSGGVPKFVDISENTYNINPSLIEASITDKTKGIIIQHNFGIIADIKKILAIAKKYNLWVIEDCAHSLGAKFSGSFVGSFGDAAIFSFGRDKVLSSVDGGGLVFKEKRNEELFFEKYKTFSYPSFFWIKQRLFHPIWFSLSRYTYNFLALGKIFIWLLQKIKLLPVVYTKKEKLGGSQKLVWHRLPNCLLEILDNQLDNLELFNENRKKIAEFYFEKFKKNNKLKLPEILEIAENIFMRFPLRIFEPKKIINRMKEENIFLGDWYSSVIVPAEVDLNKIGYKLGSCPVAEKTAKESLNLPTNYLITLEEARLIVKKIEEIIC